MPDKRTWIATEGSADKIHEYFSGAVDPQIPFMLRYGFPLLALVGFIASRVVDTEIALVLIVALGVTHYVYRERVLDRIVEKSFRFVIPAGTQEYSEMAEYVEEMHPGADIDDQISVYLRTGAAVVVRNDFEGLPGKALALFGYVVFMTGIVF